MQNYYNTGKYDSQKTTFYKILTLSINTKSERNLELYTNLFLSFGKELMKYVQNKKKKLVE